MRLGTSGDMVWEDELLRVLGICVVTYLLLVVAYGVYARCLRTGRDLKKTYGAWAVVTGATDGIGKAMAVEFARLGLNLVLISRFQDRLEDCLHEIKAKHPLADVRTLVIDYRHFDEDARAKVAALVAKVDDVGILVNNVGVSYPFTRYFDELEDENVHELISMNVSSTTWMTRLVLPGMKLRRRGAIVNMGSGAGVSTAPLLAQYGAAKSYVAMLSRALHSELSAFNIDVQCQIPLRVATKLAKIRETSLFVPSPEVYARSAVAAIGYEAIVCPYWSHAFQMFFLQHFPEDLMAWLVKQIHLGIRKRGLTKAKRAGKIQ